jgi:beta-mannanase
MESKLMKRRQVLMNMLAAAATPVALSVLGKLGADQLPTAHAAGNFPAKYPNIHEPGVPLGVYDPHGDFRDYPSVKIEHLFMPWEDVDLTALYKADAYALERGRALLITIEPWSWSEDSRLTSIQLRDAVLGGRYDETIKSISKVIRELKSPVTIRWGQEMEDASGRFTWSGWKPADYIAAYRRFRDISRAIAIQANYMWSPKGNSNLADYYPGGAYVDEIGLSVFGFQKYDVGRFGRSRTFGETLKPGYDLVVGYRKPVVVAELGYDGDEHYVANWAGSVTKPDGRFSRLAAVVYFDDREGYPWPEGYGLPDWRVF